MNKVEMVNAVAKEANVTRKVAEVAVATVFDSIIAALAAGEKVSVAGFGSFEVRNRPARVGRNPRTGAAVDVPASRTAAFKAGKAFKDSL